ncbi:hypothetical protein BLA29_012873 [Euroglyphus maynei]|uniref:Uncharacterized protein n=1 Tax=Euroglyphus maynei TaxID=6958 RepID=A0A1Y3BMS5_EURMA|nr:hypothetical protein BLA29_012873 [Euroglyphus maynei]
MINNHLWRMKIIKH